MGGVNLVEESRNILSANAGIVLGQLRSCKDESFLDNAALASRISAVGVYRHSLIHHHHHHNRFTARFPEPPG